MGRTSSAQPITSRSALFVGAHPDDIELGAGGTVARLCREGWVTWCLILTSERDETISSIRKTEAAAAAQKLGVASERLLFADLPDSHLVCNGDSVRTVRHLLLTHEVEPDVVFTHTSSDSHKDHREAHEIAVASVRQRPILGFGVVNSLVRSGAHGGAFEPKIFVDISAFQRDKALALECHASQMARINMVRVNELCTEYGKTIGAELSEGFDLLVQEGTDQERLALVFGLNDSPFHRFWLPVLGDERLTIIHAMPVWRRVRDYWWPSDGDRNGISQFYDEFNRLWHGRVPLEDHSSEEPAIERLLDTDNIMLSGGAVSNAITRNYFNHFRNVRYVIDYTMPDYTNICILDRVNQAVILAEYAVLKTGGMRSAVRDVGILTVMPNPMSPGRMLLGCMGIHGFGSLACFKSLTERSLLRQLIGMMSPPLANSMGCQILVDYDVREEFASLRESSFHTFTVEERQ